MTTKLPFDDEQAIENLTTGETPQDSSDVEEIPLESLDAVESRSPKALAYFTNDSSSEQPQGDQSLVGKSVGQSMVQSPPKQIELPVTDNSEKATQTPKSNVPSLLDQYKQLMSERSDKNNNLNYSLAGNQIAQAIASKYGAKIDDGSEVINQLRKQNDSPIDAFMGQQKVADMKNSLEVNDPNSDISGFTREQALMAMKRLNPNMSNNQIEKLKSQFSNMTAKQLESVGFKGLGGMTDYQRNMLEMQRQRLGYLGDNLDFKKGAQSEKVSKEDSDLAQKMQKSLDSMNASSRTELGRLAKVASSSRQLDLMLTNKKPEDFDNRDMQELAIITNNMLSGGQTNAISAIEKLVPKTFGGTTAGWLEYISNEPQSAQAQDFVKNFKKIADREKIASDAGLRKILGSNVNAFYKLQERQPEIYQKIIDDKTNLNTDLNQIYGDKDILKKVPPAGSVPAQQKQDSRILQYAKDNNLDYNHAKNILVNRGYKPNEQ